MNHDFTEKRILVTGGSRGIGRAISQAFASCGGRVAVNFCSNKVAAQSTVESLKGDAHILVQADVSTSAGAKEAINETVRGLGGLDVLVNNAGIGIYHPIVETDFDEWQDAWRKTIEAAPQIFVIALRII